MQTRYKATLALLLSILGFFLTVPYMGNGFFWGMVHNGFLAAMVGGLADWFAVTALFRKPLGISYRTEILKRNRDRLMNAIVTFASDDLLSVENIMLFVRKQDTAGMLVEYLTQHDGREKLRLVLNYVLLETAKTVDTKQVSHSLTPVAKNFLSGFSLENLVQKMLFLLSEDKYCQYILGTCFKAARNILLAPTMQGVLLQMMRSLLHEYAEQSTGRSILLHAIDLSDEKLLQLFDERLQKLIAAVEDPESEFYEECKSNFEMLLIFAGTDEGMNQAFEDWKNTCIAQLDFEDTIQNWLDQELYSPQPSWLTYLNDVFDKKMDEFIADEATQQKCDAFIKRYIETQLAAHHDFIPKLIHERLDVLTDDKLVVFVESRIADDLQMIRINGSLVGSIVGMLLYAVVFLVERVYS